MARDPTEPIEPPEYFNRRPTIDDSDDVDDEDGAVTDELARDGDGTLHSVNPSEVTGPPGHMTDEGVPPRNESPYQDERAAYEVEDEANHEGDVHL
jgi:hypothetical protein